MRAGTRSEDEYGAMAVRRSAMETPSGKLRQTPAYFGRRKHATACNGRQRKWICVAICAESAWAQPGLPASVRLQACHGVGRSQEIRIRA